MSVKKDLVIRVKKLSYHRNNEHLFDDFSFEIKKGSYVAVIGPNGGGKTTLMRILMGLSKPTSGTVELFGSNCKCGDEKKLIGYVPQHGGMIDLNFPATVEEIISSCAISKKNINDAMDMLKISQFRKRTFSHLSGGERQRVLLARAIAADTEILILDEPIDGLDPESREQFYSVLRKLNKSGKTILFVTHNIHRILKEADCAICVKHKLVCHGSNSCVITGSNLHDIFHANKSEMSEHIH